VRVLSFPEAETPPALRRQALALQDEEWPGDSGAGSGHDPALRPVTMLLVDDGDGDVVVVASLDVLSKTVQHAGRSYRASGLSAVVTRRDLRGLGHGRALVMAATEAIATSDADIGLFTCDRPLQAFYASAGWDVLPGAVVVGGTPAAPFPSDAPGFDKVTMARFFSPAARRHRDDFDNARIELYPGDIDRLW